MALPSTRRALLLAGMLAAFAGTPRAQTAPEFQRILQSYSAALDASDVETLVGLYGPNGVFMGEGAKPAVGSDALRAAYKTIFGTLKVRLKFSLQDAEQSGDLGWARALSTGTVKVLATGAETQQSFNLLVVFRRESGTWKIRNYIYASDKTAPGEVPK
ncbi:MAG: nuclear transport factor 2 family protein [Enhydrobacter sp.]|nr:nuclear transport factor 2 family protein [Enhydrobacter sp.]